MTALMVPCGLASCKFNAPRYDRTICTALGRTQALMEPRVPDICPLRRVRFAPEEVGVG